MRSPFWIRCSVLAVMLGLAACSGQPPTQEQPPPSAPAETSGQLAGELATATPPPLDTTPTSPIARADATLPLSNRGPWWVFQTWEHLWATNADGSGLTELPIPLGGQSIADWSAAPAGGRIAIVLTSPLAYRSRLVILSMNDRAVEADIELMSAQPTIDPAMPDMDVVTSHSAIAEHRSIAWSPDGTMLAFIGRMHGPSADLYLYRTDDQSVTQLTDGPSHAYRPIWSPDGKYILHPGVESFGTGAGYSMAGVWAAQPDGSAILEVDTDGLRGDFLFHGWLSPTTFLTSSFSAACGFYDVRSVDFETGLVVHLLEGTYRDLDLDPATGALLVLADVEWPECGPDEAGGAVLITPGQAGFVQVLEPDEDPQSVRWVAPHMAHIVAASGTYVVGADGAVVESMAHVPCPSPDGALWAFTEPEFRVQARDADRPEQPSICNPVDLLWAPGSDRILYTHGAAVHTAAAPGFDPVMITESGMYPPQAAWVEP